MMIPPLERKYFLYAIPSGDLRRETPNDINVRCPVCGDSQKNPKKARGHFYIKEGMDQPIYHCFNCGFKGSLATFLKEVNVSLYEQYEKEKRSQGLKKLKKREHLEHMIPKLTGPKVFIDNPFTKCSETPECVEYLKKRRLEQYADLFFFSDDIVKINGSRIPVKNHIIIPLLEDGKMYGFHARSIHQKHFYAYVPDQNQGYKIWNWFNVDKTREIFVFESVFDALSSGIPLKHIVAALGSDFPKEKEKEVKDVIYCLDNQRVDETSKKKSLEAAKRGKRVFIWPPIPEKDANEYLVNTGKPLLEIMKGNIFSGTRAVIKLKLLK